jgi:hypothetical protein
MTAIIITYFLGCLWFFLSNEVNSDTVEVTFINAFGLGDSYVYVPLIATTNNTEPVSYNFTMPLAS